MRSSAGIKTIIEVPWAVASDWVIYVFERLAIDCFGSQAASEWIKPIQFDFASSVERGQQR